MLQLLSLDTTAPIVTEIKDKDNVRAAPSSLGGAPPLLCCLCVACGVVAYLAGESPPPRHNCHDQNHGLTEISLYGFENWYA
jgi:hypothetical protein